jgi:hypothetical protein
MKENIFDEQTKSLLVIFISGLMIAICLFFIAFGDLIGLSPNLSFKVFLPMLVLTTFIFTLQTVDVGLPLKCTPFVAFLYFYFGIPAYTQWGTTGMSISALGIEPSVAWYAKGAVLFAIGAALLLLGVYLTLGRKQTEKW